MLSHENWPCGLWSLPDSREVGLQRNLNRVALARFEVTSACWTPFFSLSLSSPHLTKYSLQARNEKY